MSPSIAMTQGQTTLVDAADVDWLSEFSWQARWDRHSLRFRVSRTAAPDADHPKRWTIWMHRAIWERAHGPIPEGYTVDHADRDTLNNRRSNLRLATSSQQMQNRGTFRSNTSGYRGVSWHRRVGKWQARIRIDGRLIGLGYYTEPEAAARAYDAASAIHHDPDFAQQNGSD
jgi:hypothetical protein